MAEGRWIPSAVFSMLLQRIFRTLLEVGVGRQTRTRSSRPDRRRPVGVSVAGILMTGVLGILHHARNVFVASLPYTPALRKSTRHR